jgi:hypothetical protein
MNLRDNPNLLRNPARRRRSADRCRGVLRGPMSPALRAVLRRVAQILREGVKSATLH